MGRVVNIGSLSSIARKKMKKGYEKSGRKVDPKSGQITKKAPKKTSKKDTRMSIAPSLEQPAAVPAEKGTGIDWGGLVQKSLGTIKEGITQTAAAGEAAAKKIALGAVAATALGGVALGAAAGVATLPGLLSGLGTKAGVAPLYPGAKLAAKYGVQKVATNPVTRKATTTILGKIFKSTAVVGAVLTIAGTYPWSEWALGEAKEGMVFSTSKAIATGDPELIKEYMSTANEIYEITAWENMKRLIPGVNLAFSFGEKAKSLAAQWKVNNAIAQDNLTQIETGETDNQKWERVRQQQADQYTANVDYYNQQRAIMLQHERQARNEDMREAASFWRKERARQRELEAADRKAIMEFWLAYRKLIIKMQEEQRPSKLNFGIL